MISPGWQFSALQIDSSVENLIALAFPVLRIDRLAVVIPTMSANSLLRILRFASITSRLMMILIG